LYRGARLAQAVSWANSYSSDLSGLESAFLEASKELAGREEAEREAQRQRELKAAQELAETQRLSAHQLRKRAIYLLGAFVLALVMAGVALFQGERIRQTAITAQNDRRIATSRELAAASLNNLNVDPERSILLALQSISTTRDADGTILPESLEALHRSIISSPLRMTLADHGTRVLSADYSPDGRQLATIGDDGTVILWDVSNGVELARLPGTTEPGDFVSAKRVAYSPNGKLLAASDRNQVKIYDPASGDLIKTLDGQQADVTAIAFSADGKSIASGNMEGMTIIWDVSTGGFLLQLAGHTDAIEGLTFSPDGKWLITAGDDATMKIWDVTTGALLCDFQDFTGVIDSGVFSPDGTRFAFSDGSIHVWRFNLDSVEGRTTIGYEEILNIPSAGGVIFSPDGAQLAGVSGNAIKLWDAVSGRELLTLAGHSGWVMGLAFSPDGKMLASTSLDGTVKIWSVTPGNETVTVLSPVTGYGSRVAYDPTGRAFATNGGDGSITLWDVKTGEPRLTVKGHDLEVLNLAFSPDGSRFATGSLDGTTIIWDSATGKELLTLSGHEYGVRDIAFSPDGKLIATGGFDGTAKVWDATTGALIYTIQGHQGLVLGVAFSPNGAHLATSSTDATVKIWDARTGELLFTLSGHNAAIPDIAYSPDGAKLATGSGDRTAIIWDTTTYEQLLTLTGHSAGIQSVGFNPQGTLLATGSEDNTAKLWHVATGDEMLTLPGSLGGVKGVAFSPSGNGDYLAASSADGVVRIFLLRIDELLALAHSRVTRSLTTEECQKYLHMTLCPSPAP
jgi:WD40 repeat protein